MPNDIVIKVEDLSKIYKLYDKPVDRLKESLNPFGRKYHHEFTALHNVSFEIKRGETVGIIGKNGSGKSTLLKLITGIVTPSAGTVQVNGKIAALLELGAGFNPEFSGIENIYMTGTIMGYTRAAMDAKIDDIVTFADIGEFIHQPVKMYSSGMFARLAFAVNTNVNPDILIVDEVLAVGDMFFQAKCTERMKRMKEEGVTILFVSHDTGTVKSLCQRGLLINQGRLMLDSSADAAVEEFFNVKVQSEQQVIKSVAPESNQLFASEIKHECFCDNHLFRERAQFQRIRNGKAEFHNIQLLSENGMEVSQIEYGQTVTLRLAILVKEDISEFGFGCIIRSSNGVDVAYTDSALVKSAFRNFKQDERYVVDIVFEIRLKAGIYNIVCGLSVPVDLTRGEVVFCDYIPCAVQFAVSNLPEEQLYGYVYLDSQVSIQKVAGTDV